MYFLRIGCTLATGAISTVLISSRHSAYIVPFSGHSVHYLRLAIKLAIGYYHFANFNHWYTFFAKKPRGVISGESKLFSRNFHCATSNSYNLTRFFGCWCFCCILWSIAFVGLLVPHLLRLFVGFERRWIMLLSPLFGGSFLIICDAIARTVLSSGEIPVGVITAALGAPMLIGLILFRRA